MPPTGSHRTTEILTSETGTNHDTNRAARSLTTLLTQHASALAAAWAVLHYSPAVIAYFSSPILVGVV